MYDLMAMKINNDVNLITVICRKTTYANIATTGTQMMQIDMRKIARPLHHNGHSLMIVTPDAASHAS